MKIRTIKKLRSRTISIIKKENKDEDFGFLLTCLRTKETNLPCVVYPQMGFFKEKSIPRIRVQNDYCKKPSPSSLIPITVSDHPEIIFFQEEINISDEDMQKIKEWIILNKEALLRHWYQKTCSCELLEELLK